MSTPTFSPSRRPFVAGLVAMIILAGGLQAQYVSTVISNGLSGPYGVATDPNNNVYITDANNSRVALYVPGTETLSTFATGFSQPQGIVYARGGLVVVDQANQVIRFVTLGGVVTTLAGSLGSPGLNNAAGTSAQFSFPTGIAVGNDGVTLYVADQGNNAIRMVDVNNNVTTLATTYTYNSISERFKSPAAVAVDNNNNVWVTDSGNHVICVLSNGVGPAYGIAGTYRVSGTNNGPAATAKFNLPSGLLWDTNNNILVISDTDNNTIRGLTNSGSGNYSVQTLAGLPTVRGWVDGSPTNAEFNQPFGLCSDVKDTAYYVVDSGNSALRVLLPTQPPPPPVPIGAPTIGFLTFPLVNGTPSAQFNPITSQITVFHDANEPLAIEQADGTVETFMSYGPTGSNITPPGTNSDTANVWVPGDAGLLPSQVPDLNIPIIPDLTLEAISIAPGRPSSSAVSAEIEYITANPNIIGSDGADLGISNSTPGALMYYTLDGTTPTNNGSSLGPIASGAPLSLNITSNVTLSVRAFANGFAPSSTVTERLTTNNFVGNQLTIGFAAGEASTKYITAPGRTYYAPVTLTELSGTSIYSMQFDLIESGTTDPVNTNTWNFQSMLMAPTTNAGFIGPINPEIVLQNGSTTNYTATNSEYITTNDLYEISWITLPEQTNLYPTTSQDLTAFSFAHDYEFLESGGNVIVGAFSFAIPLGNTVGNTYTIQAKLPSATTFSTGSGPSAPVGVYIQTPINGTLGPGTLNSIKQVTVTNSVSYLVGDAYPFTWFNAGEFGDNNLENDDVIEVYQSAVGVSPVGGYDTPPLTSDYYDAMRSSGGANYNLYDANDNDINGLLADDQNSILSVSDVYVTLRRSLDTNLYWVVRTWSNGTLYTSQFTNFGTGAAHTTTLSASKTQASAGTPRYIAVAADQVQSGGNLSVEVPIRVLAADPIYPIRVMMLNVEIDPLDGSPPITTAVSLSTSANFDAPTLSSSLSSNNCAAAWLDSTVSGLSGTNILATLSVTLPSSVNSNSAYRVHFDHFSCSPNGLALFVPTVQDGLITVGNRSGSSWHDGISDSWRLLWFGTVSNAMSAATADPDGDGANNWQEYVAGTNPNDPASAFKFLPGGTLGPSSFTLQWSSVVNKHYSVQTSYKLSPAYWSMVATNIVGTGHPMQWTDSNATGKSQFYRATVQ